MYLIFLLPLPLCWITDSQVVAERFNFLVAQEPAQSCLESVGGVVAVAILSVRNGIRCRFQRLFPAVQNLALT